jgi:mono/diheme cytochrome c family protein
MKVSFLLILAFGTLTLASCARNHSVQPKTEVLLTNGTSIATVTEGRTLFLKNCAHCHGAEAHGDEGPDLHKLDWTDEQIARRIRNGKKGQMTAFSGKLSDVEIASLVKYVRGFE